MPTSDAIGNTLRGLSRMLASGAANERPTISSTATGHDVLPSGVPRSSVEIAFAWISAPDISSSYDIDVEWTSCRLGADGPMTTSLPRKAEAGTLPASTREKEYVGMVPGPPA